MRVCVCGQMSLTGIVQIRRTKWFLDGDREFYSRIHGYVGCMYMYVCGVAATVKAVGRDKRNGKEANETRKRKGPEKAPPPKEPRKKWGGKICAFLGGPGFGSGRGRSAYPEVTLH